MATWSFLELFKNKYAQLTPKLISAMPRSSGCLMKYSAIREPTTVSRLPSKIVIDTLI